MNAGMRRLHTSPDVFLIDNLLTSEECDDIIERAKTKDMTLSPVSHSLTSQPTRVSHSPANP